MLKAQKHSDFLVYFCNRLLTKVHCGQRIWSEDTDASKFINLLYGQLFLKLYSIYQKTVNSFLGRKFYVPIKLRLTVLFQFLYIFLFFLTVWAIKNGATCFKSYLCEEGFISLSLCFLQSDTILTEFKIVILSCELDLLGLYSDPLSVLNSVSLSTFLCPYVMYVHFIIL